MPLTVQQSRGRPEATGTQELPSLAPCVSSRLKAGELGSWPFRTTCFFGWERLKMMRREWILRIWGNHLDGQGSAVGPLPSIDIAISVDFHWLKGSEGIFFGIHGLVVWWCAVGFQNPSSREDLGRLDGVMWILGSRYLSDNSHWLTFRRLAKNRIKPLRLRSLEIHTEKPFGMPTMRMPNQRAQNQEMRILFQESSYHTGFCWVGLVLIPSGYLT